MLGMVGLVVVYFLAFHLEDPGSNPSWGHYVDLWINCSWDNARVGPEYMHNRRHGDGNK